MSVSFIRLFLLIFIPAASVLGFSCKGNVAEKAEKDNVTNKLSKPIAKLIRIDRPYENQRFSSGDNIDLSASLLGDEIPDSVRIYLDGTLLKTLYAGPWEYKLNTRELRLGKIPVKLIAYSGEKRPHTLTRFVLLFSDIVPEKRTYDLVRVLPHDKGAYTQGLLVHNGFFYEGTGQEGRSTFRKVDIETGEVLMQHKLENKFFGEGLAYLNGKFYQLTWQHNTGFVYDAETFTQIRTIHYDTQGWGLTTDGTNLFMSDGTNKIYILEPEYFTVISSFEVYDNEKAVYQLNELEYIDGFLLANIFTSDLIARIDPGSGKVLTYYDLSGINTYDRNLDSEAVLNGIAWDSDNQRLYVTGKNWSKIFEVLLK